MTQPVTEATYRVSELCEDLKLFLGEAFPRLWVQGEVQRFNRSRAGHAYFELVEKGGGDAIKARLDAVIWASDLRPVDAQLHRAGVEIEDGVELRVLGAMDLYPPQGRLQLRVRRVDPDFLLGRVEQRRRENLRKLAEQGLVDRNRRLELSAVPLRLALVTSVGSAAYHDFLATLAESGWGFEAEVFDAVVQGADAPRSVAAALERAGRSRAEAVVAIRGGGARSDLQAFDSLQIATAIATCPKPVIVGLGHQIDVTVADQVAHTSVKTPTGAASFLVDRVVAADARAADLARRIVRAAGSRIDSHGRRLAHSGLRITRALDRVASAGRRLQEVATRLQVSAGQRISMGRYRRRQVAERLPAAATRRVNAGSESARRLMRRIGSTAAGRTRDAGRRLDAYTRLTAELAPERLLTRGFSITRTLDGTLVRSQQSVSPGDRLRTQLADGSLQTRIESKEKRYEW